MWVAKSERQIRNDKHNGVKNQRIERAVENKLKKLESKEHRFNRDLEEFIAEKTEQSVLDKESIVAVIEELKMEYPALNKGF